jgi:hypothetical protein
MENGTSRPCSQIPEIFSNFTKVEASVIGEKLMNINEELKDFFNMLEPEIHYLEGLFVNSLRSSCFFISLFSLGDIIKSEKLNDLYQKLQEIHKILVNEHFKKLKEDKLKAITRILRSLVEAIFEVMIEIPDELTQFFKKKSRKAEVELNGPLSKKIVCDDDFSPQINQDDSQVERHVNTSIIVGSYPEAQQPVRIVRKAKERTVIKN